MPSTSEAVENARRANRPRRVDTVRRPSGLGRKAVVATYDVSLWARALLPSAAFLPPDFFVIGAQKSGTTSLFSYIGQHPNVRLPLRKELHLLERERFTSRMRRAHRNAFPLRTGRPAISGEATPMMARPWAPTRVYELYPSARLIAVVRDPLDRLYSQYDHLVRVNGERRPLNELIERELEAFTDDPTKAGCDAVSLFARSMYRMLLSRWVGPFAEVLVLSSNELRDDPRTTMRRVERWLDLEPIEYQLGYELNTGGVATNRQQAHSALPQQVHALLDDERGYWQKALRDGSKVWTHSDSSLVA